MVEQNAGNEHMAGEIFGKYLNVYFGCFWT